MNERAPKSPGQAATFNRAYRWWGVGGITLLVVAGLCVPVAVVLSISTDPTDTAFRDLSLIGVFWFVPAGIIGALFCGHMRYQAPFASAHVPDGVITHITKSHHTDGDGFHYELTVTAEVQGGATIRRVCTMGGKQPDPMIGHALRFRHIWLDPDELDDALFVSIGPAPKSSGSPQDPEEGKDEDLHSWTRVPAFRHPHSDTGKSCRHQSGR